MAALYIVYSSGLRLHPWVNSFRLHHGQAQEKADIRQVGTRNMGAMNVFYEVGFIWGVVVLAMDIGKGVASMAIAEKLGVSQYAYMAAGFVAVLGHSFPVFLGFKGGKGGATSIGVLIYLMKPWAVLINGGALDYCC